MKLLLTKNRITPHMPIFQIVVYLLGLKQTTPSFFKNISTFITRLTWNIIYLRYNRGTWPSVYILQMYLNVTAQQNLLATLYIQVFLASFLSTPVFLHSGISPNFPSLKGVKAPLHYLPNYSFLYQYKKLNWSFSLTIFSNSGTYLVFSICMSSYTKCM